MQGLQSFLISQLCRKNILPCKRRKTPYIPTTENLKEKSKNIIESRNDRRIFHECSLNFYQMAFYFFIFLSHMYYHLTYVVLIWTKKNGRMIVHSIIFQFGRAVKLLETRSLNVRIS